MSDERVRAALRSDAPLVVVEAPAGCGKTHQGADYARDVACGISPQRLLILTHTHAACSEFAMRTKGAGAHVEIRTIDSVIAEVASAYHAGLALPADAATWARQNDKGYARLALRVATLLQRHPMIGASLAHRYQTIICDEHQDANGSQHAVALALLSQGGRLRIFADPMQRVFRDEPLDGAAPAYEWGELAGQADLAEELDVPHRWSGSCPELGQWTLAARSALKEGGTIDLRGDLPSSVTVLSTANQAHRHLHYRPRDRRKIDALEQTQTSLLILTHHNDTARSLRSFFNRRVPLWEGHTRNALERLVVGLGSAEGEAGTLAAAVVLFLDSVGKGFSGSEFGNILEKEAREGCTKARRGKPATVQELARFLVDEPNHRGVAGMLRRLDQLKKTDPAFSCVAFDHTREFWEAVRLGEFDTAEAGFDEITHRRTYSRPRPPAKAISTIHKAKGLECESVILMPCDATTFPDKPEARCLLYVAMSRARSQLLLVVSPSDPSPLLRI